MTVGPSESGRAGETAAPALLSQVERARNLLLLLLLAGVILGVAGGWIIAAGYPHRVTYADGGYRDEGTATAVIAGGFLLGIAECLLLVSLIGYGVWLGIVASAQRDSGASQPD